jgi:hypothetical protein
VKESEAGEQLFIVAFPTGFPKMPQYFPTYYGIILLRQTPEGATP